MTMKERDYDGFTQYVCSKCGYDTFDKDDAKAHEASDAHAGPSSEVPK